MNAATRRRVATLHRAQALEVRRLLAFSNALVNDPNDDPVGIDAGFNTQNETSSIVFTPSGASQPRVVTAYNGIDPTSTGAERDSLSGGPGTDSQHRPS